MKDKTVVYYITLIQKPKLCPFCNSFNIIVKDYKLRVIKHPTLTNHNSLLYYRCRRYKCKDCSSTFNEDNPFSVHKHRVSNLLKIEVLSELKKPFHTYSSVAQRFFISNTQVIKIFDSCIHVPRINLPTIICMDEVHLPLVSYNSSYVFLMMDFETNNLIEILPTRRKQYLSRYFAKIPKNERLAVKYVCIDMWPTYRDITHKYMPDALVIVDSFHVVKNLLKDFISIRIHVMKNYEAKKDTKEYYLLKNWNWLLTDKDVTLDNVGKYNKKLNRYINYRQLLELILSIDSDLDKGYSLLNMYYNFNDNATLEDAEEWFDTILIAFIDSNINEFKDFITLLKNWRTEIIHSFTKVNDKRLSNGPMESLNGRFNKLETNANGLKNYDRLRNRSLYCFNKSIVPHLNTEYKTNKVPSAARGKYKKIK